MFTAVEALSRIAIEYAVNVIYITESEDHTRAKSLLQHYIDNSMKHAKAWKKHAEETKDSEAISAASWKIQHLESIILQTGLGLSKATSKWPGPKDRFKAIGLENLYHVLFSSASDSIHSLSEDVFNLTCIELMSNEMKQEFFAEKESFAMYLATNAILFLCEASIRLATIVSEYTEVEKMMEVAKKVQTILAEHEHLSRKYREKFTTPPTT